MSNIQLYLLEVDKNKPEARRIAYQSAVKLEAKTLKLIDLITSLEEYINNKDDGPLRAKSVAYLADVLESLAPRVLSGQERRLLCDFILGRIEGDNEGIGASARVLLALEERSKWDAETVQRVAHTFVDHVSPLKDVKLQTDRYQVIQLFDQLMGQYRTQLKTLHDGEPDFLQKLVFFFDGEKDPRNLMVVFSLLHVPMTEWDIQASAQDLFEAVFNYFPITFKPPPDDPYRITAQDLKDRLQDCISASSEFAPYAFPALLDKLDSTSMNTKRDVLNAIAACVKSYEVRTINLYSVTLWDALKYEILNVQEEDLAEGALKALSLIGGKFALQEGPLNAYLKPIIKECNEHMEDAPTKQSSAAGRILHAIATAATPVADKIAKGVIPTLFSLYQASESMTKRRGLLEIFNEIVLAYLERFRLQPQLNLDALKPFASDSLGVMLRALAIAPQAEVSFRLAALAGISQLLALRGLLSEEQGYQAVDAVTEIIIHERIQGHGDIRSEAIKTLAEMARSAPDTVRDRAIPAFMVELPDQPQDTSTFEPVLEAFAQLSCEQQIFNTVVLRLKNKYNAAKTQGASNEYQQALLLAILYAFTHGSPTPDASGVIRSDYFTEYVEPFVSAFLSGSDEVQSPRTVEIVGRLCNIILRPQGVHYQSQVYNRNLDSFAAIHQSSLDNAEAVIKFAPFSLYYYAALRPEVIDAEDILSLLRKVASIALNAPSSTHDLTNIHQLISLLINKFINPKTMQATLATANIDPQTLLTTPTPTNLTLTISIIHSLLLQGRSHSLTTATLTQLLTLLPTPTGAHLAPLFTHLLAPSDILTKANHCLLSPLHKQKTFTLLVPTLITSIRTADTPTKPNYLIALSGILRWLPYEMLLPTLPTLLPPLLQTLDLTTPATHDAKSSTLAIFESTLMHDPELLAEHTSSLITRLLSCTAAPNLAGVRAKALQCLTLIPKMLRRELVVPFRRQVVKRLMGSLDDGRRGVRGEGVRARKAWLGLDDEEGEGE